jgi:hypothetical protein
MRARRGLVAFVAACVIAALVPAYGLTQGDERRPDLIVAFATEPPQFELAGGRWRITVTVSNQGERGTRRSSIARAYFSPDQAAGDDIRLGRSARIPALPAGGQASRRMTVTIPATVAPGRYFLIVCADDTNVIDESDDARNCSVSGQQAGINVSTQGSGVGAPGAQGPAGPAGPKGDRGSGNRDIRTIPRTTLDVGDPNVDDPGAGSMEPANDTAPDEGSTQARDLITVGGVTFRGLCRNPTSDEDSGNGDDATKEQEAKIVVQTDSGSMSFQGRHGPRGNVPAGLGTAGLDGADGGEGQRQVLSVVRDENEGFGTGDEEYVAGYGSVHAYVVHTSGTELIFDGYAGVDTLGQGTPTDDADDKCVFGGTVTVVG